MGRTDADWQSCTILSKLDGLPTAKSRKAWDNFDAWHEHYIGEERGKKTKHLAQLISNEKYAERMSKCGRMGSEGLPYYCRVRICPTCQWRRQKQLIARTWNVQHKITSSKLKTKLGLLTLTVKSCDLFDLRDQITLMNRAFAKCCARKVVKDASLGSMKAVEVNRRFNNQCHAHIHAIFLLKSYRYYISKKVWRENWQDALKIDYEPQTHWKQLPFDNSNILAGLTKYMTKPATITPDKYWMDAYANQVHDLKFFTASGIFRDAFATIDILSHPKKGMAPRFCSNQSQSST